MHKCEQCHIEYQPKHKGSRFCSQRCANIRNNLNRWASAPRLCPTCGNTLVRKGDHAYTTYCSKRCAGAARTAAKDVRLREQREVRDAERMAAQLRHAIKKGRSCVVCGSQFTIAGRAKGRPTATCSDACREKRRTDYTAQRDPEQRRVYTRKRRAQGLDDRGKNRKRARRFGVAYERIIARKVYERDGWRCQLCHKAINLAVKVPHPLSATLDHIIPMSKGGPHTYTNVQAAHFSCNTAKGVKSMDEQMLLIGAA